MNGLGWPGGINNEIPPINPLEYSSVYVPDLGEAPLLQGPRYFLTPVPHGTVNNNGAVFMHLAECPQIELFVANGNGPRQVAHGKLGGLPGIQHQGVTRLLLQVINRNGGYRPV